MLGDIILARFPLSDRASFKERPCLVVSRADPRGDFEVLKISSRDLDGPQRLRLEPAAFSAGSLPLPSCVVLADSAKVNRAVVTRYAGRIHAEHLRKVLKARILSATREFSCWAHPKQRPGWDPEKKTSAEDPVPYAGRVFQGEEVEAAVGASLDFWLTLGPEGEAFEQELASFLGVKHTLLVNSGLS